ncbi:MAG: hypothetical protein WCK65_07690 [Rhodospirillaceae bacterium]
MSSQVTLSGVGASGAVGSILVTGVGASAGAVVGALLGGPVGAGVGAFVVGATCASIGAAGLGRSAPPEKLYTIHDHIRDNSFAFKEEREARDRARR